MKKYQTPKQIAGFSTTIYPGCSEDIRGHVSYRGQMVGLVNASKEVEFLSSALENALGKKLLPANLIGNLPADGIVRVVTKIKQDTLLDLYHNYQIVDAKKESKIFDENDLYRFREAFYSVQGFKSFCHEVAEYGEVVRPLA